MKNFELPSETVENCATENDISRHAGSIPVARSPSESSTYESSVEASVEFVGGEKCNPGNSGDEISPPEPPTPPLATESGHWYLPDGSPFYTVPRKSDGKGGKKGEPRAVNLSDARKVNAVPSVTGITCIIEKPALNNYKAKHIFKATVRLYGEYGPDADDEFFKRVQAEADAHRDKAADRGTRLHTAIENYLLGQPTIDVTWKLHIEKLVDSLAQYGIDIHDGASERSFAHPLGYGGKVDWHRRIDPLVFDVKSKDLIDDKKLRSWCDSSKSMQLAAYRVGLAMPSARGLNIFVGEEDCEVRIFEWPKSDLNEAWEKFQLLLQFWKKENHYYPKIEQ